MTVDIQRETFVGRDQELARLHQFLQDLEASRASVIASIAPFPPLEESRPIHCVLLTGPEGIGKTRLAEEAAHEAIGRGWEVLWTSVSPHGEELPYHLWTQVLQQAQAHGLVPMQEVTHHPQLYHPLGALLPEINPCLDLTGKQAQRSPRQETGRLWEAMRALLAAISTRKPLLVVLDDLHQASVCSIALLAFLARRLSGLPILLLGTCGENDRRAPHPLHGLLGDLQRDQDAVLLPLAPLSDAAICQLAHQVSAEQAQSIAQAVAGNPFLATELVRSSTPPDEPLPASIQAVFGQNLAQVSQPCQHLLTDAAILGESFTFDALCAAVNGTMAAQADWVLDLVEEALHAHLLTETVQDASLHYAFAPPLLHTALVQSHKQQPTQPARRRRRPVLLSLLLVLVLVSTWGGWRWHAPQASRLVWEQATYQLTAVTGQPDPSQPEVQARLLSTQVQDPGELFYFDPGPIPAGHAIGRLLFLNDGAVPRTLASTTLMAKNATITFNGPIVVGSFTPFTVIEGYRVQSDTSPFAGLLGAQPCCATDIVVKSAPFAAGTPLTGLSALQQEERAYVRQWSAVDGSDALSWFGSQIQPGELPVPGATCTPHLTTSPSGTRAVLIQAPLTCVAEVYNFTAVTGMATALLATHAMLSGARSLTPGSLRVTVLNIAVGPAHQVMLRVQVQGIWHAQE